MVNLQIAAVNNTIAKNLYLPNWESGQVSLVDASGDQNFDPKSTAQLCIVLNESTSSDI